MCHGGCERAFRSFREASLPFSDTITMSSCLQALSFFMTLRVQVPNKQILTQNLYSNSYYPNPKYLVIGYTDPLGDASFQKKTVLETLLLEQLPRAFREAISFSGRGPSASFRSHRPVHMSWGSPRSYVAEGSYPAQYLPNTGSLLYSYANTL